MSKLKSKSLKNPNKLNHLDKVGFIADNQDIITKIFISNISTVIDATAPPLIKTVGTVVRSGLYIAHSINLHYIDIAYAILFGEPGKGVCFEHNNKDVVAGYVYLFGELPKDAFTDSIYSSQWLIFKTEPYNGLYTKVWVEV